MVRKKPLRRMPSRRSLFILGVIVGCSILAVHTLTVAIGSTVYARMIMVKDVSTSADPATDIEDSGGTPDTSISAPVPDDSTETITTYVVQQGDTLSEIASAHHISVNTIRWANDLTEKDSKIKVGDTLVILPVTGVQYTVKKGDTISGIAARFGADQGDILKYNDIEKDSIKVGMKLIIPGAELKPAAPKKIPATTKPNTSSPTVGPKQTADSSDDEEKDEKPTTHAVYAAPIHGATLTQGLHDGNAVDFGTPIGTAVLASADGVVTVAKSGGYNGGYGSYIVITHPAGSQTLYAHLSSVGVSVGDSVSQGDAIGRSGNSGLSTGPHLHFKILNGPRNPFSKYKVGTHF